MYRTTVIPNCKIFIPVGTAEMPSAADDMSLNYSERTLCRNTGKFIADR